ncbi:signal transduction histidine kinase [Flammeovirgaceae bacterium 311]|nr:signal transduction histidine kinase [Flammeovirgaceae bacterium 311]
MTATNSINSGDVKQVAKILLVEDNRVSRLVAERLLKRWCYGAESAVNGQQAVSMAVVSQYALILMNLGLPDISGREAAAMIRQLSPLHKHTPIIAFSANLQALRVSGGPFTDSLQVPYMPEQLRGLLQLHISVQPGAESYHQLQAQQNNRLEIRLDVISGKDPVFRQQLIALYTKSCRELLSDLELGLLDNANYLDQVRHKHRSSLRLLELYSLEAALDNLQEVLGAAPSDQAILTFRKQAVAQQATAVIEGLSLQAA